LPCRREIGSHFFIAAKILACHYLKSQIFIFLNEGNEQGLDHDSLCILPANKAAITVNILFDFIWSIEKDFAIQCFSSKINYFNYFS